MVLFELSEFLAELSLSRTFVQDYIDSFRCEKAFRLLHFVLSYSTVSVKLYAHFCAFPFSFGKTYNLDYLSSSVRFLLKSFFYSVIKDLLP